MEAFKQLNDANEEYDVYLYWPSQDRLELEPNVATDEEEEYDVYVYWPTQNIMELESDNAIDACSLEQAQEEVIQPERHMSPRYSLAQPSNSSAEQLSSSEVNGTHMNGIISQFRRAMSASPGLSQVDRSTARLVRRWTPSY